MKTKIVIVGGGIAGLCLAYHLIKKNNSSQITVIESHTLGSQITQKAAGMIAPASEAHPAESELNHYFLKAANYYRHFIAELLNDANDDVDFYDTGTLMCATNQDGVQDLTQLYDWHQALGIHTNFISPTELQQKEPLLSPRIIKTLYAKNEFFINPQKLMIVLKKACDSQGVCFLEHTTVENIVPQPHKTFLVRSQKELKSIDIEAHQVIIATGLNHQIPFITENIKIPLRPVKGQVLSVQCPPATLQHMVRIYHRYPLYLVPRKNGEIVIGATSEELNDTNLTAGALLDLIYGAWTVLPFIYDYPATNFRVGLRAATPDHKPIVGPSNVKNIHLFLGLHRHGILLSPFLAKELAKMIGQESHDLDDTVFSLQRFESGTHE